MQNYCQKAKGVNSLRALHLKNPNPVPSQALNFKIFFESMSSNSVKLDKLS